MKGWTHDGQNGVKRASKKNLKREQGREYNTGVTRRQDRIEDSRGH
jgi:hypothetical protein